MAAEATYSGSRELFLSDNIVVWFPAAILGHHALEMLLKCALIRAGHVIERGDVWGHVLVELAKKLADSCDTFPTHIIDDLAILRLLVVARWRDGRGAAAR